MRQLRPALFPLLVLSLLPGILQAQEERYVRAAVSVDWPRDTRFHDNDCSNTAPPALFGCAVDASGQALAARGELDRALGMEAAIGYRVNRLLRLEGMLQYRPDLEFVGQANFLGVSGEQPVTTDASALGAFVTLYADLPDLGRLQPYAGVGVGASYNRLDATRYGFPGLGASAATVVPSGSEVEAAWLISIGAGLPLGEHLMLDVMYRYSDLGELQSAAGDATIVRQSGTRAIPIDGTAAELRSQGVVMSLRYRF